MVISRPMMTAAVSVISARGSLLTISTSATATMSLSATGSRNAPRRDVCPRRLARYPSSESVIPASANSSPADGIRPRVRHVEQQCHQGNRANAKPRQGIRPIQRHPRFRHSLQSGRSRARMQVIIKTSGEGRPDSGDLFKICDAGAQDTLQARRSVSATGGVSPGRVPECSPVSTRCTAWRACAGDP